MQDSKIKLKKIIRIAGFFIAVLTVLKVTSVLLDPVRLGLYDVASERERYMLSLLAEQENTVDVVMLGDSESYTVISPMELWEQYGLASYVAGQAGQHLPETYYSLKRILKKQKPKLVIVETNEIFIPPDNLHEAGYALREKGYYCFPFLKYHGIWKNLAGENPVYPRHYNGFEIRTTVQAYTGGAYMQTTVEQAELLTVCRYYLNKIKTLCEKNGATLLLVTAPSAMNHTTEKHNALVEYSETENVPYVDLNMVTEEIGLDWNLDTLDAGDHLNFSGVMKTNSYIGQYLEDHYNLPDHRGEAKYELWDTRLEEYKYECSQY